MFSLAHTYREGFHRVGPSQELARIVEAFFVMSTGFCMVDNRALVFYSSLKCLEIFSLLNNTKTHIHSYSIHWKRIHTASIGIEMKVTSSLVKISSLFLVCLCLSNRKEMIGRVVTPKNSLSHLVQ